MTVLQYVRLCLPGLFLVCYVSDIFIYLWSNFSAIAMRLFLSFFCLFIVSHVMWALAGMFSLLIYFSIFFICIAVSSLVGWVVISVFKCWMWYIGFSVHMILEISDSSQWILANSSWRFYAVILTYFCIIVK
jgi:hypothetical protein